MDNKFYKIFCAALISGTVLFNATPTKAAIVTDKLPLLTYADHVVYTYDAPNGKKRGSITPSTSLVLIKKIQEDGWAYGSYKIANQNKRVNRWFKMNDLQGYADFENYDATAYQDFTATRTRTSSSKVGHVAKNDKILVVAKKSDSLKVIFNDEAGQYRMGWIPSYVTEESTNETTNDENLSDELNTENFSEDGSFNGEENSEENNFVTEDETADENLSDETTYVEDNNSTEETSDELTEEVNTYENSNIENNTKGDINGDGNIDAIDIALLMNYVNKKTNVIDELQADVNEDGKINIEDAQSLLRIVKESGKGTGDVNGDGKINNYDIEMISAHIEGKTVPINRKNSDLNGDSNIDETDLEILKELVRIRG